MQFDESASYYPTSATKWRQWLVKNHEKKQSVWLISYKKELGKPGVSWSDAVDEALCFGWIDSKKISLGDGKSAQYFCKRKPKSTWSAINKKKVEKLIEAGLMMPAGHECIKTAQANGSWNILDKIEALTIPKDLNRAFTSHPGSKKFFTSQSKSVQKLLLHWIMIAKKAETRENRIAQIALHAAQGKTPKV